MRYGVFINGIDALNDLGLFLCDDLKIGEAKLNEVKTKIPGSNKVLDSSYVLSGGEPTFSERQITFSLQANSKAEFESAKDRLFLWHGRKVKLILPDDLDHYWDCTISFVPENKTGINKISVSASAYPYKLKHEVTQVPVLMLDGDQKAFDFENEGKRVYPIFTLLSGESAVAMSGGAWHTIQADMENLWNDIFIEPGGSRLKFRFIGSVKVSYQEGKL